MTAYPFILNDGISKIAKHNGVHRITFVKLTGGQKPETARELMIPVSASQALVHTISRLR